MIQAPLRIGFSLVDLALGGAQAFLVQLAQGLAERGHRLEYYLAASRDDPSHCEPSLLNALDEAAARRSKPQDLLTCDLIQLDGYHSLKHKLPYLLHLRRCVETYHSGYSLQRSRPLLAQHRVAVSRAVQKMLQQPSQVITCGVRLPAEIPTHPGRRYDLAILGRIHPVKNHRLFLEVCEALHQQRGSLNALIVGGHPAPGAYQEEIDAHIARLRAQGLQLQATGNIPPGQVFDWLAQAKLLLVTSHNEGFGRMAVEALACRTPVIANPVGGLLEIVQDGLTGFFAVQDQVTSFVALAGRLLDNELLRQELGYRGRMDVQERFSMEATLDAYEALYRRVAAQVKR